MEVRGQLDRVGSSSTMRTPGSNQGISLGGMYLYLLSHPGVLGLVACAVFLLFEIGSHAVASSVLELMTISGFSFLSVIAEEVPSCPDLLLILNTF